uniref:ATP-dependent Clp protease proteolytic subunit n=1 Tax=Desulfobacca acetoxidans TaxID=60893 RepID=A0A7V4G7M6_9BACT
MGNDDLNPGSILFRNRIIFLFGPIDQDTARDIIPRLLVMNSLGTEPIKLFINSPGGESAAGLAIYDTMRFIQAPVYTICIGQAASMATWLLAAGAKGNRVASENAQIMIHQGRTLMGGTYADLKISMEEFDRIHQRMINILSRHTGKDTSEIAKSIDRDYWMTPQEALEFGIIDKVVSTPD